MKPRASHSPAPSRQDQEVESIRARYLANDLTVEEFEAEVGDALVRSSEPQRYSERVEIHVWGDPPPGHSLHIHL
jgi:hypothetical protein